MATPQKKIGAKKKTARRKPAAQKTALTDATLITGASGGIGKALAGEFAKGGSDLILVARSEDKLERIAADLAGQYDIRALALPADLSLAGAGKKLFEGVEAHGFHIHTLVNNAGILEMGAFSKTNTSRHLELIQLNITALTELTSLFVPPMIARGGGRILNVASIAAFQPVPSLATYAATKAFVLSLTESLAEELKQHGITATALCPGVTDTNMVASVKDTNDTAAKIPGFLVSDVAAVAAEGYSACIKGEVIRVPGIVNMATAIAGRASPRWLVRAVSGALGRLAF